MFYKIRFSQYLYLILNDYYSMLGNVIKFHNKMVYLLVKRIDKYWIDCSRLNKKGEITVDRIQSSVNFVTSTIVYICYSKSFNTISYRIESVYTKYIENFSIVNIELN